MLTLFTFKVNGVFFSKSHSHSYSKIVVDNLFKAPGFKTLSSGGEKAWRYFQNNTGLTFKENEQDYFDVENVINMLRAGLYLRIYLD